MFVSCRVVCCVCSGLCVERIARSEESYTRVCLIVCNLENATIRWPRPELGCRATKQRQGSEVDLSLPSSAAVKNAWRCTSTSLYTLMVLCLIKYGDIFVLLR
jgi:hypothetical protein